MLQQLQEVTAGRRVRDESTTVISCRPYLRALVTASSLLLSLFAKSQELQGPVWSIRTVRPTCFVLYVLQTTLICASLVWLCTL